MKNYNSLRSLTWILVALMPLWFGSCSKSSDTITPSSSAIEGTWQYKNFTFDRALFKLQNGQMSNSFLTYLADISSVIGTIGTDIADCFTGTKITFNTSGKVTGTPGAKCTASNGIVDVTGTNATWKVDGSKLTVTESNGSTSIFDIALSGKTLKLSQPDSNTDYDNDGKNDTVVLTLELTKL